MKVFFIVFLILFGLNNFVWGQTCIQDTLFIFSQDDINNFSIDYPNCSEIEGSLYLRANNFSDLSGLDQLTQINGDLVFFNASTQLIGFNNLEKIGGDLSIFNNNNLEEISGFDNLDTVSNNIFIQNNRKLKSINGFSELDYVGRNLRISKIDSLTNLDNCFENLNSIGNEFVLLENVSLRTINGFSKINSIGSLFSISSNPVLQNVEPLINLKSLGSYLEINNNDQLLSLRGLDSIDHLTITNLFIRDNELLDVCGVKSVCDFLKNPANVNEVVENNAFLCNSSDEIRSSCLCVVLSLSIFDFRGHLENSNIRLEWKTIDINNYDGFHIEKSINGINWTKIGFVEKNYSPTNPYYHFIDTSITHNGDFVYYRLVQVNASAEDNLSNILSIKTDDKEDISLYPIPANEHLFVNGIENASYSIIGIDGKVYVENLKSDSNKVDISFLSAGTYMLLIKNNKEIIMQKFLRI